MSHLGRRLSALIDGELGDDERDQVHAHLATCEPCRAEAAALRTLKRRMRGLGETPADSDLTRRLIALAGLPEPPAPARPRRPATKAKARAALTALSSGALTGGALTGEALTGEDSPEQEQAPGWEELEPWLAGTGPDTGPMPVAPVAPPPAPGRRGHTRFVVAGAVAALAVSLGAASFAAGGEHGSGPTVKPEVDLYSMEQSVSTGQVPAFTPRAELSALRTGVYLKP